MKPEDQPRLYKSVLSHVEIPLPEEPMQYTYLPNSDTVEGIWGAYGVNERNVSMTATETLTTNARAVSYTHLTDSLLLQVLSALRTVSWMIPVRPMKILTA